MTKPKTKSPLEELATQADETLAKCWDRLRNKDVLSPEDVQAMVSAWRMKRRAFLAAEETKSQRKEERESDKT